MKTNRKNKAALIGEDRVCDSADLAGPSWISDFQTKLKSSIEWFDPSQTTVLTEASPASWTAVPSKTVVAPHILQQQADFRGSIQAWFALVRPGGYLVITVPGPRSEATVHQRAKPLRAYTLEMLIDHIEQSLEPADFTLRQLSEVGGPHFEEQEFLVAIEKAASILLRKSNADELDLPALKPLLDRDFQSRRTRIEKASTRPLDRVLVLKLDHLGDFIMGRSALELARTRFADSHLTLVVGSWNEELARAADVADEIITFDAFPRNSSLEKVDLAGRAAAFASTVSGRYDLAIDLRTDPDTRFYLENVDAALRAGLGTRAQFPFLDIFLPIDLSRHEPETAREDIIGSSAFPCQPFCTRGRFRIHCDAGDVSSRLGAVVWGPYIKLRPGHYFFEPYIDFSEPQNGILLVDIAFDCERRSARAITAQSDLRIDFHVEVPGTLFEFRIFEPESGPALGFDFFGGRLVRQGADSVLHQSEYLSLLVELVTMRMRNHGLLGEF